MTVCSTKELARRAAVSPILPDQSRPSQVGNHAPVTSLRTECTPAVVRSSSGSCVRRYCRPVPEYRFAYHRSSSAAALLRASTSRPECQARYSFHRCRARLCGRSVLPANRHSDGESTGSDTPMTSQVPPAARMNEASLLALESCSGVNCVSISVFRDIDFARTRATAIHPQTEMRHARFPSTQRAGPRKR